MSSKYENNSNSLYHEYFENDDNYCHISLVVNFDPLLFDPDGWTNLQPDWSIDRVGNAISEKSIASLRVKYEILSLVELKKPQIGELSS